MRHQKKGRKFGRETGQRKAMIKLLLNSLVKLEKLETTEAKAKEIRPKIEKMITKAKLNTLAAKRDLGRTFNQNMVKKLTEELGPKYKERHGGYTRIIKMGRRINDASSMAKIEFV